MVTDEQFDARTSQRDNYHRLICVECLLLLVSYFLFVGAKNAVTISLWTMLGLWHVVVISMCVLYLFGRPVVMTLSPLISSAEARAFRRELRQREKLDDDTFYRKFYASSGIPSDFVAGVRNALDGVDSLMPAVVPSDNLFLFDDDLDFADVLDLVEEKFGIRFAESDYENVDGSLGNLILLAHEKLVRQAESSRIR